MRKTVSWAAGVVCLAAVVLTAAAGEKKIDLDKLPAKVRDAVKAKFDGATLVEAAEETENGKTHYEVTIKYKGQNIDVTTDPDGKIVSVEKEIKAEDFPKEVRDALEAKYPKAKITKAEEITKDDKITYEALITTADNKKLEVVLDPKGKILEEEKKDEEKKDKTDKKDKK